jgi:hypothetical protein
VANKLIRLSVAGGLMNTTPLGFIPAIDLHKQAVAIFHRQLYANIDTDFYNESVNRAQRRAAMKGKSHGKAKG